MFCFQVDFQKVQTELTMAPGLHPQVRRHHPGLSQGTVTGRGNSTFFHPTENIDIYPPGMLNFVFKTRCLNFGPDQFIFSF